ncbi:MAG TPA: hypothetical protein V6D30_00355 [Leptolyngbyaceae cyanobacterium]
MKAKRSVPVTEGNKRQIHPTARGLQYFRSRGGSAISSFRAHAIAGKKKVTFANSGSTGICKRSTGLY